MSSATVETGIDAYTPSDNPDKNYGGMKTIIVRASGPVSAGFIWFKSPVPLGATVLSATLRLYGKGTFSSLPVVVNRATASWSESRITYNNRPSFTGTSTTVTQANTDGAEWVFDVTAQIQSIADGAANYGFRIGTSGTRAEFYSLNNGTNRPALDVTWSDAPDAPHTLSPSGGRSVSLAKPVLRFDYVDVSGSQLLQAVQVQIDPAANWTSPGFDSGTVASSLPELDLTTTSYAGLSAGSTTQWRVRVQDAAGLWSDWSDSATFSRTALPALTITNPAVSPNNFVSEFTPPITWTFTGQAAYRVRVSLDSDPAHPLYDSGKITATTTTVNLPAGVLTSQTATYRVTVDAWDAVSREATPGDPGYVEASRAFTFNLSATVATVTSLAVTPNVSGSPAMALTWNRSTAPDSFTVLRDGVRVDSGLLPADLLVSGTQYRYVDRYAAPNRQHTWTVQAVVNGVTSSSNPTVTGRSDTPAVWIASQDLGLVVPVHVTENYSFDMPETAATYYPVGPGPAMRITQALRGLEGTVSGRIVDWIGTPAATWVANMLAIKKQPTLEVSLALGAQSLRVRIGNVVVAPLAGGNPDDRACSFSFWSLDGPQ